MRLFITSQLYSRPDGSPAIEYRVWVPNPEHTARTTILLVDPTTGLTGGNEQHDDWYRIALDADELAAAKTALASVVDTSNATWSRAYFNSIAFIPLEPETAALLAGLENDVEDAKRALATAQEALLYNGPL